MAKAQWLRQHRLGMSASVSLTMRRVQLSANAPTALMVASMRGHEEAVRALVDARAAVDAQNKVGAKCARPTLRIVAVRPRGGTYGLFASVDTAGTDARSPPSAIVRGAYFGHGKNLIDSPCAHC